MGHPCPATDPRSSHLAIRPAIESLTQDLGRPPSVVEIAENVGASEESVLEALEAGQRYRTASIDASDRHDSSMALRLGQVDNGFAGSDDRHAPRPINGRPARTRAEILRLRFVDGLTQSEIAAQIGVSQMQVSRLLAASLAQLREALTREP